MYKKLKYEMYKKLLPKFAFQNAVRLIEAWY